MRGRHSHEHQATVHDAVVHAFARHRGDDPAEMMLKGEGLRTVNLSGAGFSWKGVGRTIRHLGRTIKQGKHAVKESRGAFKSAAEVAESIKALAS